jgi:hypothetical protein
MKPFHDFEQDNWSQEDLVPMRCHSINLSLSSERVVLCSVIIDFGISPLIHHHRENISLMSVSRRRGLMLSIQ